ncbi:MAG: T9SS type A sorting domain-containing protein [Cytophagaceae bacterium]|nr:MAG: T9SS type A sorting domain-containing protein [Cytophagaceae bacterium]
MTFRLLPLFLFALFLLGVAGPARAQAPGSNFGFEESSIAKVVQGADTLPHAWAGGLNAPQFSSIDLNYDGQPDLYAFDRQTTRSYTFLSVAVPGGRRWQYAPVYENAFPTDLESWVALRDYNCDGQADMFTYTTGGNIRVFRNMGSASTGPVFELTKSELNFALTPTASYNLAIGYYNMPSIQDINGDGRLDILSYDFISSNRLELYLNTGTGTCTDLNSFQRTSNYWGLIQACADCASYQPNAVAQCQVFRPQQTQHSQGHNIVMTDLNGDGVLDLIDGRDNCPQLVRLLNAGTNSVASFTLPNITSSFPVATPLSTSVFPAPFLIDTDFDGVKDLVVAANQVDNLTDHKTMRHTVQQFRNTSGSASAVPSYTKVSDGFLQNDMLDLSEGAAPTFGDIDGDGLTDMLVGNQADLVNGYYRASLAYYRNVGTVGRPVFRLITDDYLGLAATAALTPSVSFESLRPFLVDLNRDGAIDLVYSILTGTTNQLRFILNTAPAAQAVSFNPALTDYFRPAGGTTPIAPYAGDTPCFFDIDGDGYVDLLLGSNDTAQPGPLLYFHNRGAGVATNSMFTLANANYGAIRSPNTYTFKLSPTIADFDGDTRPDLVTVDGTGTLHFYSDFRSQSTQFTERTDLVYNRLTNSYQPARLGWGTILRYAPAAADLNRDGTPELYVGTEAGGIISYLPGTRTVLATTPPAAAAALALSVYPNPAGAGQSVTIETAQPTSLRVYDLTGRLLRQDATAQRTRTLSLSGFAAGLYVVQATAPDGTRATQRLAVGQ